MMIILRHLTKSIRGNLRTTGFPWQDCFGGYTFRLGYCQILFYSSLALVKMAAIQLPISYNIGMEQEWHRK